MRHRLLQRARLATLLLATCASGVASGCAGDSRSGGFDSAVPGARIDAIEFAVARWRATPEAQRHLSVSTRDNLIECLRSDDSVVRFLAIEALYEFTGERHGYRYDDPLALRVAAIDAWVHWAMASTHPAGAAA